MSKKLEELESRLAQAIESYNTNQATASAAQLRELNDAVVKLRGEIAAAISEGASPCPSCGRPPHGMRQNFTLGGRETVHGFEIGCTACRDHRAVGFTRENALEKWHAGPVQNGWRQPSNGERLEVRGGEIVRVYPDGSSESCKVERAESA